jgi:cysteine desulfurase
MVKTPLNFDENAGAGLLDDARAAMLSALDLSANASSVHSSGRRARAIVESAREHVGAALGVGKDHVVFTSGATEATALALSPVIMTGRESMPVGRLYVAASEHPCVLSGGRLADRLSVVPVSEDGLVDLAALARLLADHDRSAGVPMLALMLANNETGVIQPVKKAAGLVHQHGGFVFCDAVQAIGRVPVDLTDLDADFISISSHKIGGPQGAGALVLAKEDVRPVALLTGGGQERGLRAGTENVAAIAGFGVAAGQVMNHVKDVDSVARMRDRIEAGVRRISPDVQIAGEQAPRIANTAMVVVPGISAETAVIAFDLEGVAVSSGSACSSGKVSPSHVLQAMGFPEELSSSGIRISLPADVSEAAIERFLEAWRSIEGRLRPDKAA